MHHTYHLRSEMLIPRSITDVFPFFENPANLNRLTPPWLHLHILTKDPVMHPGLEITYRIRLLGLPMTWTSVITDHQPPFRFVDEQKRGPYRYWKHTHSFRPHPDGTLVGDHVEYALPFGPFGGIAHAVMVRPQLKAIFTYRRDALARHLNIQPRSILDPVIAER